MVKEFVEELLYMCSSNNTKSRKIYIVWATGLVLMIVGAIAMLAMLILNAVLYHAFSSLWLGLFILDIVLFAGAVFWLNKG